MSRTEFYSKILIFYLKHSVTCIFNENTVKYNVKTSWPQKVIKYSNFNFMGEMDKSRELYSREGDNASQFEGKPVAWEYTIIRLQKKCAYHVTR